MTARLVVILALWLASVLQSWAAGDRQREDAAIVGLLLPAGQVAEEVRNGARLAADRFAGDEYSIALVSREGEGPWTTITTEMTRLIYEDAAAAVIGGLDGRRAHVAQQVVARARGETVFLTPWASEDTLTGNGVPWFFRMLPDDRLQARVLVSDLVARGIARVALWSGDTFDAIAATEAFKREAAGEQTLEATPYAGTSDQALERLIEALHREDHGAIVAFVTSQRAARLVAGVRQAGLGVPFYGPMWLTSGEFMALAGEHAEGARLVAPAYLAAPDSPVRTAFRRDYQALHGTLPTPPAYYAHDAVLVVADALGIAREASVDLTTALSRVAVAGVTGRVKFGAQHDGQCNCDQAPVLAVVEEGILIPCAVGSSSR